MRTEVVLAALLVLLLAPPAAAEWPDFVSDPWGVWSDAFGPLAGIITAALLFAAVGLTWIKTQSFAPSVIVLVAGCVGLASILPANLAVQKLLYIVAALGVAAMLYRAFAAWRG